MNGRQRGARAVWMGLSMESGVDGGVDGRWSGARGGVEGCGRGKRGGSCGWTEAVYEACFRVSLKHASSWAEIFRKLRLKGLQMEMILGERGV